MAYKPLVFPPSVIEELPDEETNSAYNSLLLFFGFCKANPGAGELHRRPCMGDQLLPHEAGQV
jgi:hypothetical protein